MAFAHPPLERADDEGAESHAKCKGCGSVAEFMHGDHEDLEQQKQEKVVEEGVANPDEVIGFGPAPPPGHRGEEPAGAGDPDEPIADGVGAVARQGLHQMFRLDRVAPAEGDEPGDPDSEEERIGVEEGGCGRGEEAAIHVKERTAEEGVRGAGGATDSRAGFGAPPHSYHDNYS